MSNTENKTPVLELKDLGNDVLIGRYKFSVDEDGRIQIMTPKIRKLPDISMYINIGNTNYFVSGEYVGDHHLEDKISRILKRNMEV